MTAIPEEVLTRATRRFGAGSFDQARLVYFPKNEFSKAAAWGKAVKTNLAYLDNKTNGWRKCHTENYWCYYARFPNPDYEMNVSAHLEWVGFGSMQIALDQLDSLDSSLDREALKRHFEADGEIVIRIKKSDAEHNPFELETICRRISDLHGDCALQECKDFVYEWHNDPQHPLAGYEKYDKSNHIRGGVHYSGTHHPNVVCEGNPCKYCGAHHIE